MRVLIIEDEPKMLASLKQGLEEQEHIVDIADNGEDGLHWGLNFSYDVIVLDIMLPRKDGFLVCKELRHQRIRTPILMLTALDDIDNRVEGLDCGADDYLVKPFAFRELLARIRALSRRDAYQKSTIITLGDLQLDTLTRSAQRGAYPIPLSTKEYALLELLMRHQNQVLSRQIIAEHLWRYDDMPDSNVVDVYIRYLRRKIDDKYDEKYISTVRGTGYRLTTPDKTS